MRVAVVATLPLEPGFTEGLAYDGRRDRLIESTGLVGHSEVRAIDPDTGAVQARVQLPGVFGEGVAVTAQRAWQLTWRDGVVVQRDPDSLREIGRMPLVGTAEGWGLCTASGGGLLQTAGTATVTVRDPDTFAPRGRIQVRQAGRPVTGLNAIDCSHAGLAWANVFPTNRLVGFDPTTGEVRAEADLSALRQQALAADPSLAADPDAVPNGIASYPGSTSFYATGKGWRMLFRIELQ
jgi:glutamine cyclotransferase